MFIYPALFCFLFFEGSGDPSADVGHVPPSSLHAFAFRYRRPIGLQSRLRSRRHQRRHQTVQGRERRLAEGEDRNHDDDDDDDDDNEPLSMKTTMTIPMDETMTIPMDETMAIPMDETMAMHSAMAMAYRCLR